MPLSLDAVSVFGVDGKIALVTGGGSGIGLLIAKGLAENGAKVYIGSRRKALVDKAAASFTPSTSSSKGSIVALELDVTSKESIAAAVKLIESADGKLDILVNNAGIMGTGAPFLNNPDAPERASASALGNALFESGSFSGWSDVFNTNISSVYFVTVAFLGLLQKGTDADEPFSASVVNITSISGNTKLGQGNFAYNASKAALDHLTKMLATEFALKNIKVRVNALAPGLFPSEITKREGGEFGPEETTKFSASLLPVPAGRSGRPEEIAGPALMLVSKAGRYINGQILIVDGSWLAVNPSTR